MATTFERTQIALAVFHRLMCERPMLGNGATKMERWDRDCLTAVSSTTRCELLEELARFGAQVPPHDRGHYPEAARFQEVVDLLSVRPDSQVEDGVMGWLHAIG